MNSTEKKMHYGLLVGAVMAAGLGSLSRRSMHDEIVLKPDDAYPPRAPVTDQQRRDDYERGRQERKAERERIKAEQAKPFLDAAAAKRERRRQRNLKIEQRAKRAE